MILVRRATRDDATAWLRMRAALWPEEGVPSHAGEIGRYVAGTVREPMEILLAVDDSGTPIGLAELSIRPYAEGCVTDSVAYVEGWYVDPRARRTGVGRALIGASQNRR